MVRIKYDYGIDLGTTNSSIARMENGVAVIKKTKTLMDTMPSCVYFAQNRKGEKSIRVGSRAKDSRYSDAITALHNGLEYQEFGYIEFKREMGSDKTYSNPNMPKSSYTPEELSAEVLKELKSLINDEQVTSVVITVPAMFTAIQKEATMKAAKLAGFSQCQLLQEPIAACMAYGLSVDQKDGRWLVFDFGGGTFDAALVKVEDGILTVHDTEGDNYLGGKNLDEAVINKILMPHLSDQYCLDSLEYDELKAHNLKEALKGIAEELRVELSFAESCDFSTYDRNLNLGCDDDGEDIELDIHVTQDELRQAIEPYYQKAIDICKRLLERNNLDGSKLSSLILVGGPTYSPMLRDMLQQQITPNVDTKTNPMTAVATGAALYASTLDSDIDAQDIVQSTDQNGVFFNVLFESTSVETFEWVAISLDQKKSGANCPSEVQVVFERGDGAWTSDKVSIDSNGNVIEAILKPDGANLFKIKAFDSQGNTLNVFPKEFTIIQGIKVNSAPLPYNIGISLYNDIKECGVFKHVTGLEKNKPLPAVGILNDRRTTQELRPGNKSDRLVIPVYQAPLDAEGSNTAFHTKIGEVSITGAEVNQVIAADSEVDITIKVDKSEIMSLEVFFPSVDLTIKKNLSLIKLSHDEAQDNIEDLVELAETMTQELEEASINTDDLERKLDTVKQQVDDSKDNMRNLSNIKELLVLIEKRVDNNQWFILKSHLDDIFKAIDENIGSFGDGDLHARYNEIKEDLKVASTNHDVVIMRSLIRKAGTLLIEVKKDAMHVFVLHRLIQEYDYSTCTNVERARLLMTAGMIIVSQLGSNNEDNADSNDKLLAINRELFDLNPPMKNKILRQTGIDTGGLLR